MEMLIIGSGCFLGYLLNKDGKQSRSDNRPVMVSPNRLPLGTVIYDNNRVADVDNYVRNLAAAKHAEKVRQMFPHDYTLPNNIFPNDLQGDVHTSLIDLTGNNGGPDSARSRFANNVQQAAAVNVNTAAYNPDTGKPFTIATTQNIDTSPMFRPSSYSTLATEFAGPVSLLTGLPLEMTHANMNPMFGKMVRQPGVSNENSQVLLEMYTGMPSSDDQGTYRQKREVINPLPNNPENLQRANINQVSDFVQRVSSSIKPSHEYKTPVKAFRDLPMKNDVRIIPTTGVNKKQVTYGGVMIPGQKGSTRPMTPNMRDNRWDLLHETKNEDLVPTRSVLQGSKANVVPTVRNVNATSVTENNYFAPANNWKKVTNVGGMADMYKTQMDEAVTRRIEPFAPGFGGARGRDMGPNTGVYMMKDPEKGFANERQGQPHQGKVGGRLRDNVSTPEVTLRDILSENKTGAININGLKDNTAWKKQNLRLDVTNKSMNAENPFRGQPFKNLGMGQRKHKIQKWVTNKEMNQFSKQGNPKGLTSAPVDKNAVIELDTNKEVEMDHYGVATALNNKPISDGGEIVPDGEKLMVTDYTMLPKGMSMGRDRQTFIDGTELEYDRVDFGGYYKGVKVGNGDDAKRSGRVQIKEEMIVEGRMNVPLKRDNPNDTMEMEANLRPEKETIDRKMMTRTQPKEVITDRTPMLTRVKNTEVINPRLDITTKVTLTSDPYPWIKDKGTQEDTEYDM